MTNKQDIKNKFKTGDKPTGSNFSELIDFADSLVINLDGSIVEGKQLKVLTFEFLPESYEAEDGLIGSFDELEEILSFDAHVYDYGENGFPEPYNITPMTLTNTSFSARVYELQTMAIGYTNVVGVKVTILGY